VVRCFIRPVLRLSIGGGYEIDTGHLIDVFDGQRQQFVATLRKFEHQDWAAPTRCSQWCAQDVVRHLADGSANVISGDDMSLARGDGFDPRTTPVQWLAASEGETPDATLDRFASSTEQLMSAARGWLASDRHFEVSLPYGRMDWPVLMLHVFWDSWIHERDVLLTRALDHPVGDAATRYATAYGLFIAAAIAARFGAPVSHQLSLGGEGGGIFELSPEDVVTLTATSGTAGGSSASSLADALAGRDGAEEVLSGLPVSLSWLGEFFNAPVA
jgi:uncharacterized protein (TIGR03083 family)